MSYARWSETSDVYVFLASDGWLECCGCFLNGGLTEQFWSTQGMLDHLDRHEDEGHNVPTSCRERLRVEATVNDAWLTVRREAALAAAEGTAP